MKRVPVSHTVDQANRVAFQAIERLFEESASVEETLSNKTYRGRSVEVDDDVHVRSTTAVPAGGTTGAGLKMSSTTNFGVFFGSGAPTLSAAKGSLYMRSDGTTTNDRMYVNTDGGTTWTAVTTAA